MSSKRLARMVLALMFVGFGAVVFGWDGQVFTGISLAQASPSPTPTPTPTCTSLVPVPTAPCVANPLASPTPTPSRTASPSATPTRSPSPTPTPTPTPTPSASASSTASPSPSPTRSQTATPSPTPTPTPSSPDVVIEENDSVVTARFLTQPDRFVGRVSSAPKCERNRQIVLKRVKTGRDAVVGRDTTNDAGRWKVFEPNARGRYYAKVTRRVFTRDGLEVRCRGDRSRTVRVGS